ncbi:hypothetical protein DFJ63DRAFT_25859 [Scheffersomyces coipomensis]|uniref:uncharacterized protein n=1 Tax=Scheffersomyces coipomensis TaxID=1788519 RepID=UPI00315D4B58
MFKASMLKFRTFHAIGSDIASNDLPQPQPTRDEEYDASSEQTEDGESYSDDESTLNDRSNDGTLDGQLQDFVDDRHFEDDDEDDFSFIENASMILYKNEDESSYESYDDDDDEPFGQLFEYLLSEIDFGLANNRSTSLIRYLRTKPMVRPKTVEQLNYFTPKLTKATNHTKSPLVKKHRKMTKEEKLKSGHFIRKSDLDIRFNQLNISRTFDNNKLLPSSSHFSYKIDKLILQK